MKTNTQTDPPRDTEGSSLDTGSESFRDRFCTANGCAHSEFADRVLLLTLHFHALPIALLLWPWRKRFFAADHALIEKVGGARWRGDVRWKLNRLITREWLGGLGRRLLRCRISSQRLGALMMKMMGNSLEA